jgi:hypothetical protein
MWSSSRSLFIAGAFAGLTLAPRAFAATASLSAPIQRMDAKIVDELACRTSSDNTVADMPLTSKTFTLGGSTAEEVVVTFVGEWPIPSSGTQAGAFILLEIDNDRVDLVSTNGGVLVHEGTATSVSNGTRSFTFVTEPIRPGSHVAKIRWADNVLSGTGTICVGKRSLTVIHR